MESQNLNTLIRLALEEDIGHGDLTALSVPSGAKASARLIAKSDCVASCLFLAPLLIRESGAKAEFDFAVKDGAHLKKGELVGTLHGNARDLLGLERTLLNFWQRLFGIASQAAELANLKLSVLILDTRKTTPGMRVLEKRAVRDGGLHNHRFALDSGVLVKENHIRAAGGMKQALTALDKELPKLSSVEVEVTSEAEALDAIAFGVRLLLLDNFSPKALHELVPKLKKTPGLFLEASGGIARHNIAEYAATGVDAISLGFLTHSVPAADLSLLFDFQ